MQTSNTTEQALEALIERSLTGTCLEELKQQGLTISQFNEPVGQYVVGNGFYLGNANDFDAKYALDRVRFWDFLESTQALELEKLKRSADWRLKVLERFDRLVKKDSILAVLKKGIALDDAHLCLFYVAPNSNSAQAVHANFAKNQFSVTRQVRYSLLNPLEEVDMVIFLNGIAIISMELKNPATGQCARVHGQKQYRETRDIQQTLFNFARCLVHFAVDPDEVYMTTKLNGKATFFLPFNKGCNDGAGNPVNPEGHKTAYLWQEVFTRLSLATIIQNFVLLQGKEKNTVLAKKDLIFPRYHQLDVVRKLLADVTAQGVGQSYLIQHSAGSGKSHSITWLAFQLIDVYPAKLQVDARQDKPLFDSVIVVTDRRLLDKQIRDNISAFSEVRGIVAPALSANELRLSLEAGKRIIITTIQKFPFMVKELADMGDKRFAVIIDEAHSSQSGTAADTMNISLGNLPKNEEGEIDAQDMIVQVMHGRKMRDNASYFAFTATPKNNTLERFGQQQADGTFKPFHLYSMKQAIEEGFILDVLSNYTTYRSYYEIAKSIQDNPLFDSKRAQSALKAYVERDRQTIAAKAEIMLKHFVQVVCAQGKLKGRAKAMVLTQSIESAIRYYQELNKLLSSQHINFKIAIAFSGAKKIDGIEYTEASLNGFADTDTKDKFDTDEYRILVVANKYLTGFDQPKLSTMYVDKKLQGVLCVQALSRLNRSNLKLGKRSEDLFVLDFFNEVSDIKAAFDDFYTSTSLSSATDVNVLHDLKDKLDEAEIYLPAEIEEFNSKYFSGADAQELSPFLDAAALRFNQELDLSEDEKADLKVKAKQFIKIYGQMAAIMPFDCIAWEKLFWFLKFLVPKLKVRDAEREAIDALLNAVDLSTYALERVKIGESIVLDAQATELDPQNPNPRGAHTDGDKHELEEIIKAFNERWFSAWGATPEDKREKFISLTKKVVAHPKFKAQFLNNQDQHTREIALNEIVGSVMLAGRKQEMDLYRLWLEDSAFKTALINGMRRAVDTDFSLLNKVL